MAKQKGNKITREVGDACPRELCGGTLDEMLNGTMKCVICEHSFNRVEQVGEVDKEGTPRVIVPDEMVLVFAKATLARDLEIMEEVTPPQPGEPRFDAETAWVELSPTNREGHRKEAQRVLEKVWPLLVAFAKEAEDAPSIGALIAAAEASKDMRNLLTEVAIPSLKYCEEKFGHDDQARLNLEAGIGQ